MLGARVNVANPLDYHLYIWGDYEQLNACFAKFLGNKFACTLLVLDYPPHEGADQSKWKITEQALIDAVEETGQRAVIVASLPETLPADVRRRLAAAGIAPMQGIEDCIFAARAAVQIGATQDKVADVQPVLALAELCGDAQSMDEVSSKSALAEHGVTIPSGQVCTAGRDRRSGDGDWLSGRSQGVVQRTRAQK